MAMFLTRVQLHAADGADYQRLHEEMERRKFSRTITNDAGTRYHLPEAEYYSHGELSAQDVRDIANAAVAAIGKTAWVLTVLFTNASWVLPRA